MRRAVGMSVIVLALAGCTTIQAAQTRETERMLVAAGFQMRPAGTPEARAYLRTLPTRKLLTRSENGEPQWAYADPTGCECLYVGTEQQYQELLKLQRDQGVAAEQRRDVERQDAFYGLWGGTWPPPLQ